MASGNVTYDNTFDISSQETQPVDLAFNTDGTKMFVLGRQNDAIFQYSLTTGFNISSASYDNISFSITSQENSPWGLSFNSNGTKMFMTGTTSDEIHQYSLTNGFSLAAGNVTYDNISFDVSSQDPTSIGVTFSPDGNKMFIVGYDTDRIYQYSLTNSFSMASGNVTYDNISFDVSSQELAPLCVEFNTDGTKMFVIGTNNSVYQYSF
jgi:6-phosphogluconolactonase (cycloisomerase 2 family)